MKSRTFLDFTKKKKERQGAAGTRSSQEAAWGLKPSTVSLVLMSRISLVGAFSCYVCRSFHVRRSAVGLSQVVSRYLECVVSSVRLMMFVSMVVTCPVPILVPSSVATH